MKKKEIIKIEQVEDKILILRGVRVILDTDVADLYNVETREINQAVKNNPEKFPKGYVFTTTDKDLEDIKNFDILEKIKFFNSNPKAFTERGLYMLATILKGKTGSSTGYLSVADVNHIRKLSTKIRKRHYRSFQMFCKKIFQNGCKFENLLYALQHRKLLWFQALISSEPPKELEMFKEADGGNPQKSVLLFP